MLPRVVRPSLLLSLLLAFVSAAPGADTLSIDKTPLLTVTLPANGTHEVQTTAADGSWVGTGVLVNQGPAAQTVRLDGFPAGQPYRFAPILGGTVVSPSAVSTGLHLRGSFPGASEARVETSDALASWAHYRYGYPHGLGTFLRPLLGPFPAKAFFRAVRSANPIGRATLTAYTADPGNTASGFGEVLDDMPAIYRNGFIAAVCPAFYNRGGMVAAAAGECYELNGPNGTTTVMVADNSNSPPGGVCEQSNGGFFDLNQPAFDHVANATDGLSAAFWRLVPAPVTGPVKMHLTASSNEFYQEYRIYNHRAGVASVEVKGNGSSTWTNLTRTSYNAFVHSNFISQPASLRVTSRFGEVITFPPFNISANARVAAATQFTTFPDVSPAPVWSVPYVFGDSSGGLIAGEWSRSAFSGATLQTDSASPYAGSSSLRVANVAAFSGVRFALFGRFRTTPGAALQFAIKAAAAPALTTLRVRLEGLDAAQAGSASQELALPAVQSEWRVIRIPLSGSAPAFIREITVINAGSNAVGDFLLDEVEFIEP